MKKELREFAILSGLIKCCADILIENDMDYVNLIKPMIKRKQVVEKLLSPEEILQVRLEHISHEMMEKFGLDMKIALPKESK